MRNLNVMIRTVASVSIVLLAGCASKPTASDLMRSHATEVQAQVDLKNELAKDWDTGSKLVASGEKKVKDGEKRVQRAERNLEKGRHEIEDGTREIAEGRKLMEDSERRFRESFPGMGIRNAD